MLEGIRKGLKGKPKRKGAEPQWRNKNISQLLNRASFFVHGLPRSRFALSGRAPKRAEYTEKQLVYLSQFQLPSFTTLSRCFRFNRCFGVRFFQSEQ
jgi:hypothetical protein